MAEEKKKEKEPVFVESDPQQPFPQNTFDALKKEIKKLAKDLDTNWPSTVALLNKAFEELQVPVPNANLIERWEQYRQLIKIAVEALRDSRGFGASWSIF